MHVLAPTRTREEYPYLFSNLWMGISAEQASGRIWPLAPSRFYAARVATVEAGAPTVVTAPSEGKVVYFDGSSNYSFPLSNTTPPIGNWTIVVRARIKDVAATRYGYLLSTDDTTSSAALELWSYQSGATRQLNIDTWSGPTFGFYYTNTAFDVFKTWVFTRRVGAGGGMAAYVDGKYEAPVSSGSTAAGTTPTDTTFRIGDGYAAQNNPFTGDLRGVVIYPFCVDAGAAARISASKYFIDDAVLGYGGSSDFALPAGSAAKPWLYGRSSTVSRPYLQVA